MPEGVELHRTGPDDPRLTGLISDLDQFFLGIDGDVRHKQLATLNRLEPGTRVVIAVLHGRAVACGALRSRDMDTGEVKRMFVQPDVRGRKIGAAILRELEAWAVELGHTHSILETMSVLEVAIRLYEGFGYRRIPSFPPYDQIAESVCYGKVLSDDQPVTG